MPSKYFFFGSAGIAFFIKCNKTSPLDVKGFPEQLQPDLRIYRHLGAQMSWFDNIINRAGIAQSRVLSENGHISDTPLTISADQVVLNFQLVIVGGGPIKPTFLI